jgi:ABC-2 type transport system ATP-binding protein/lipopolysaccharide transport system ATP-binding protein
MTSISLEDVSVDIPIFDIRGSSLRKAVLNRAVGGRFAQAGSHVSVSALKNITFEARDGDRVALVGHNGSGKSTLLRVLADVYPPTSGSVHVAGRVSAMFDATLGMSMDATGWENIRMCGRLWGLTQHEIDTSIPDIVEFTELGDYLSLPVRTYSTGMMLRLAFAIATVRAPEIMLIDEVIGVGDARFFDKAFMRLRGVVERSRILFVASHADEILRQLCEKAIWLQHGRLMAYGKIDDVIASYRSSQAADGPQEPAVASPGEPVEAGVSA